jgi:hypothetical protein
VPIAKVNTAMERATRSLDTQKGSEEALESVRVARSGRH